MPYTIGIVLRLITALPDRAAERCIEAILDALAFANWEYLREHPETPALYLSGVRYKDDAYGEIDHWKDIPSVLAAGAGDCDDLVPWRIAELWQAGYKQARSVAHLQRDNDGNTLFHAYVRVDANHTEDPSERLGMP